ncbi:MAG: hypothetical protein K2Q14_04010 [Gammaproteobacteria bacterium]|nr:hypothetical protein [Gammaproteobacteria bacterium]
MSFLNRWQRWLNGLIATILLCSPTFAFAASTMMINAAQMLENIDAQLPYFYSAVSGFAYLCGLFFMIAGIHAFKEFGNGAMSGNKLAMKEPLAYIIIGAMLIYLPTAKDVFLTTVYGTATVSAYVGYGVSDTFNEMGKVIVDIVQFVGFIAFVRGLMMMHKVGVGQTQQGASFNKGLTHLIGGVIAMNIVAFGHIISTTLGIST